MGYQPNVVNKDDIVQINGVSFKVLNDFNNLKNNMLFLKRVDVPERKFYIAGVETRESHDNL